MTSAGWAAVEGDASRLWRIKGVMTHGNDASADGQAEQ
jgi:hypothetical protein